MKLIVGLGNPGATYHGTRHNVGFDVVDEVARRRRLAFESSPADAMMARERGPEARVMLAKPLTFMNRSGDAVGVLARYFRFDVGDLLVVVDDVNLPLGRLRARAEGSDGGHNGLRSVIATLATSRFSRLRLGVGRGEARRDLADHVLDRFDEDEWETRDDMLRRAADAVELFVEDGISVVMNRFNAAEKAENASPGDPEAGDAG